MTKPGTGGLLSQLTLTPGRYTEPSRVWPAKLTGFSPSVGLGPGSPADVTPWRMASYFTEAGHHGLTTWWEIDFSSVMGRSCLPPRGTRGARAVRRVVAFQQALYLTCGASHRRLAKTTGTTVRFGLGIP